MLGQNVDWYTRGKSLRMISFVPASIIVVGIDSTQSKGGGFVSFNLTTACSLAVPVFNSLA